MRSLLRSFAEFLSDLRSGSGLGSRSVQFTQSDNGLLIASNLGDTLLDTRRRMVLRNQRIVASFLDVKSVRIRKICNDDQPELWEVSLRTSSLLGGVDVAATTDDAEASILGARLSEVLGVPVVA